MKPAAVPSSNSAAASRSSSSPRNPHLRPRRSRRSSISKPRCAFCANRQHFRSPSSSRSRSASAPTAPSSPPSTPSFSARCHFPTAISSSAIHQHDIQGRDANRFVAPVRLEDWNRLNSTFQAISGYYLDDLSEISGPLPEKVTEGLVAPRFLETSGNLARTRPQLHIRRRALGRAECRSHQLSPSGSAASTVIPTLIGKKLHVGAPVLMPSSASCPHPSSFPPATSISGLPSPPDAPYAQRRDSTWFTVIGRLKPGISVQQAHADLATVQANSASNSPNPTTNSAVETTSAQRSHRRRRAQTRSGFSTAPSRCCFSSPAPTSPRCCSLAPPSASTKSPSASRSAHRAGPSSSSSSPKSSLSHSSAPSSGLLVAAAAAHWLPSPRQDPARAPKRLPSTGASLSTRLPRLSPPLFSAVSFPPCAEHAATSPSPLASGSRTQVSARNPLQWVLVGRPSHLRRHSCSSALACCCAACSRSPASLRASIQPTC